MIIREAELKDLKIIDKLNNLQADFKLNNIDNCIIQRIVFDGTIPIAYGIVRKLAEAIMLVDPHTPKLLRAKAMRELMMYAEIGSKTSGCEQLHCFVSDPKLAFSLEKQFGFKRTKDIVLVKNL